MASLAIYVSATVRNHSLHPSVVAKPITVLPREYGCRNVNLVTSNIPPVICDVVEQHESNAVHIGLGYDSDCESF